MTTFKAETASMSDNANMFFGFLTGNHADTIAVDIRGYWLTLDVYGIYRAGCFTGTTGEALERWSDDRLDHDCHISRRILLAAVKATMGVNPIHITKEES
jgi:hypothetical protein